MPEIYPLEWSNERLKILDQTKLPKEQAVIIASNYVDVLDSIKSMSIRGLSIISIAAGYALTLAAKSVSTNDVQKFLEELGFEVISINGFKLLSSDDICGLKPNQIYEYALDNFDTKADTLVFSCTGLHTEPILQKIENELKRPTISSNTVALWEMLRKSKIEEKVKGHGKLLSDY